MYLADIGNRYAHLYNGRVISHLSIDELIKNYHKARVYYINVNPNNLTKLSDINNWIDLSKYVNLDGSYEGMGIDRQTLLLSREDGIYIDAGSAITIDKKLNSKFQGGTILPGIWRVKECYADISSVLKIDDLAKIKIDELPTGSTKMSVSYGIIAPIVSLVNSINSENLPIYCCGGDGKLISSYIEKSEYIEDLIFEGMKKVIKESRC